MKTILKNCCIVYALAFVWLFSGCAQSSSDKRFSYELLPVQKDKWGYIDNNGKVVIDLQFEYAHLFCEGLAMVKANGKWGYIGKDGKFVINPVYVSASNFSEGMAFVTPENGHPICIDKAGKVLFKLDDIDAVYPYTEGLACVQKGHTFGCIDKNGKTVIPFDYRSRITYSEGLAAFYEINGDQEINYGYMDKRGTTVIKPQFAFAINFKEGMAMVRSGPKVGFINRSGAFVINPQFDGAYSFNEGYAAIVSDNKWGYIDKSGKIVVAPQFDGACSFRNGLAGVKLQKWGYIDKQGKYVINPQFELIGDFCSDITCVQSSGMIGFIDKQGKYRIDPQYRNCNDSKEDIGASLAHFDFKPLFSYFKNDDRFLVYSRDFTFGRFSGDTGIFDVKSKISITLKPGVNLLNEYIRPTITVFFKQAIYKDEEDKKYYNYNAQPGYVQLEYNLLGDGIIGGKGAELAKTLKEELISQFKCKETPEGLSYDDQDQLAIVSDRWAKHKKDPENEFMLFCRNFTFVIDYDDDEVKLGVVIM